MRPILLLAAATVLSTGAIAQSSSTAPASPPSGAAASKAQRPAAKSTAPTASQWNKQMKAMEEMHAKMLAAKTPEERQALMADHMRVMRDGMAMMGQVGSGKGGAAMDGMGMGAMHGNHDMMSRRMDMMQLMMQMMMDRESAGAPAAK